MTCKLKNTARRAIAHPERSLTRNAGSFLFAPSKPALAVAAALAFASPSWSNPTGGQVVAGQAAINSPTASSVVIDQASNKAIINWNSFSIGASESVRFNQPSASSIALNRVLGNTGSEIFGSLSANGQIFLINPNGVLMGRGAQISAAGFLASSLGISDSDFLAGRYSFTRGTVAGSVINEGTITTSGGYTALIAPNVENRGFISARLGSVGLAAGDRVTLDFAGDGLMRVGVDQAALTAAIRNSGTITADGGRVILSAKSANALLDTVLNNDGVIRADTLVDRNGTIALESGAGILSNSGSLLARGLNANETGGNISVTAPNVLLTSTAVADVSGTSGGGNIFIGGNYQGLGPLANAQNTIVETDAGLRANATDNGNGGQVVVWANGNAAFGGHVSAQGGPNGGDGGKAEVSGRQHLNFQGTVDTMAAHGNWGSLLLDPSDITISNNADSGTTAGITAAGFQTFIGTSDTSNLNVTTLQNLLNTTPVQVQADSRSPANGSGKITVADAIVANNTLSLWATNDVTLNANVTVTSGRFEIVTSGNISAPTGVITAPAVNLGGANIMLDSTTHKIAAFGVFGSGAVGSLSLKNGVPLTIAQPVSAPGGITITNSDSITISNTLTAGTGNISLTTTGSSKSITQTGGGITAGTLSLTTTNGSATLNSATNAITNLGTTDLGFGALNLLDTGGLTVTGAVNVGAAKIQTSGPLAINNVINVGSSKIELITTGAGPGLESITQSGAGALTAFELNVTTTNSNVALVPTGAINDIGTLGNISTGSGQFSYTGGTTGALGVQTINAGSVTVTNKGAIITAALNTINAADNVMLRSTDDVVTTQGNTTMTSTNGNITVRAKGKIDLKTDGGVALSAVGGDITLISDTSTVAAQKYAVGKTLTVQVGPGIALLTSDIANGVLSITAPNVALTADTMLFLLDTINAPGGAITLAPVTPGTAVTVGGVVGAGLFIGDLALSKITSAAVLNIGQTGTNSIIPPSTLNVTPAATVTAGSITLGGVLSTVIANPTLNLISGVTTGSAVTQLVPLILGTPAGAGTLGVVTAGGNVDLSNGGNAIGTLGAVSTGNGTFTLNDSAGGLIVTGKNSTPDFSLSDRVSGKGIAIFTTGGDLEIKGVLADAGNTFLTNTIGNITQTVPAPSGGNAISNEDLTISAPAGAISLTNSANALNGEVKITNGGAGSVAITNSGGLILGTSTVGSGTLTITALGGPITQSGSSAGITQATGAGAATFNAGANAITLDKKAGNVFTGPVSLTGSDIEIATTKKLAVTLNASGNAKVTGDLDIEGAVGGNLIVDALTGATNFGTPTGLNTTVGGNLSLTNTDTVTQTAGKSVQVTGTTLIDASAKDASITLTEANNHFTDVATFKGSTIQITDNGSLNATLAATGASTLNAAKNLTVTGSSKSLTAANTNAPFTVAVAALSVTNGDLNITSAGQTVFGDGTTNVNGNVNITSTDAVSQTGGSQLVIGGGQLNVVGAGGASINAGFTRPNNTIGTLGNIALGKGEFKLANLGDLTIAGTINKAGGGFIVTNDGKITHQAASGDIDTSKVTSGAAADGNISLTATNVPVDNPILLNANLNAGAGTVTLQAGGSISQAGAGSKITAGTVNANATGNNAAVTLAGANAFNTVTGAGTTEFLAVNSQAFNIGTAGVASANGNVTLRATAGDLTLTGPVSASPAAGSVSLQATAGSIVSTAAAGIVSGNSAELQALNNVDLNCLSLACAGSGNAIGGGGVAGIATNGFFALQNKTGFGIKTVGSTKGITSGGATLLRVTGTAGAGNLTQQPDALISSGGGLAFTSTAGDITLDAANTVTGNIAGSVPGANAVTFRNAGGINVGPVTIPLPLVGGPLTLNGLSGNNVTLTSDGGTITQSTGAANAISAGGLTATAIGNAITLTNVSNDVTGTATLKGGTVQITDANALTVALTTTGPTTLIAGGTTTFGASTVGGTLDTTSAGAVLQTGALTVTGTTTITAGAGTSSITLNTPTNDFQNTVTLKGSTIDIADANQLTVAVTATGTAKAKGNLTYSGTSGDLTLTAVATPVGTLILGDTVVNGNLVATAEEAVSQLAGTALTVTGTSSIDASANNKSITLNNPGNHFGTLATLKGSTINVADNAALTAVLTGTDLATLNAATAMTVSGTAVGVTGNAGTTMTVAAAGLNGGAGAVQLVSPGDLTLNGVVSSTAAGNSITLATTAGNFINNAGAAAVSAPPAGRFLIYSGSPLLDTIGGLAAPNKRYGTNFGDAIPFAGFGFLYRIQPTLTITADDKARTQGTANPALTFTPTGFIAGDTAATALAGAPALTTTATPASAAGAYPITAAAGTLTSPMNYALTFAPGTLTVTQNAVTIVANNQVKFEGTSDPVFTFTATTPPPGFTTTGALTRAPGETSGNYAISIGSLASAGFVLNYVAGALTIVPNPIVGVIAAAAAASGSTATTAIPLVNAEGRPMMCLIGDVELLYYPRGEPIRIP